MAERNLYNLKLVQFLPVLSMQAHFGKNQTVELHVGTKQMHDILKKKKPHTGMKKTGKWRNILCTGRETKKATCDFLPNVLCVCT